MQFFCILFFFDLGFVFLYQHTFHHTKRSKKNIFLLLRWHTNWIIWPNEIGIFKGFPYKLRRSSLKLSSFLPNIQFTSKLDLIRTDFGWEILKENTNNNNNENEGRRTISHKSHTKMIYVEKQKNYNRTTERWTKKQQWAQKQENTRTFFIASRKFYILNSTISLANQYE